MPKPVIAALALLAASAHAADSLHHHAVVAGGGSSTAGNVRLDYSIGQPVSGTVAHAGVVLHSGVLALFPTATDTDDRLFRDGFDAATSSRHDSLRTPF